MPSLRDFLRLRSERPFTPLRLPWHRLTLGLAGLAAVAALAGRAFSGEGTGPVVACPLASRTCAGGQPEPFAATGELAVFAGLPDEPALDCAAVARGRVMTALVLGQSNASNTVDPGYDSALPVYAFADGVCTKAHDALPGTTGAKGSVWPRLGDKLAAGGFYDAVVFADIARGGSSILEWGPGGRYNAVLLAALDALDEAGLPPTHILFHQGEADCAMGLPAAGYAAALDALIGQLRGRIGRNTEVIVARTSLFLDPDCGDKDNPACYKTCPALIEAQSAAADPDRRVLSGPDTDRLVPWSERNDGYHFTSRGADRVADAWLSLVAPDAAPEPVLH